MSDVVRGRNGPLYPLIDPFSPETQNRVEAFFQTVPALQDTISILSPFETLLLLGVPIAGIQVPTARGAVADVVELAITQAPRVSKETAERTFPVLTRTGNVWRIWPVNVQGTGLIIQAANTGFREGFSFLVD